MGHITLMDPNGNKRMNMEHILSPASANMLQKPTQQNTI